MSARKFFTSLVMPITVALILLGVLPAAGAEGSAVYSIALTMAGWGWIVALIEMSIAGAAQDRDANCHGLFAVIAVAIVLGGFGSAMILSWLADATQAAIGDAIPLIAIGLCLYYFIGHIAANAVVSAIKNSRTD
jgi:hypothetical protein